mgnify:CR=1 FL=1
MLEEKYGEMPLSVLFIGHNPSEHSWESGHYFSQPSNRFWRLLIESGIVEADIDTINDDLLVDKYYMGFTDVVRTPNSNSSSIKRQIFVEQRTFFYKRIILHAKRVKAQPQRIAFVGKRQFSMLFDPPLKSVCLGLQDTVPPGFPFECEIWVLSSPSGRAAMTWKSRLEPYVAMANSMHSAFRTSNIE